MLLENKRLLFLKDAQRSKLNMYNSISVVFEEMLKEAKVKRSKNLDSLIFQEKKGNFLPAIWHVGSEA